MSTPETSGPESEPTQEIPGIINPDNGLNEQRAAQVKEFMSSLGFEVNNTGVITDAARGRKGNGLSGVFRGKNRSGESIEIIIEEAKNN